MVRRTGWIQQVPPPATPGRAEEAAKEAFTPAAAVEPPAFTWQLTVDQDRRLDDLALKIRQSMRWAQLDRAMMLWALTLLAEENPILVRAVADRLLERQPAL